MMVRLHTRSHAPLCLHDAVNICFLLTAGYLENLAELEEKTRLINQVLELQHTLEGTTDTHPVSANTSCTCCESNYVVFARNHKRHH